MRLKMYQESEIGALKSSIANRTGAAAGRQPAERGAREGRGAAGAASTDVLVEAGIAVAKWSRAQEAAQRPRGESRRGSGDVG